MNDNLPPRRPPWATGEPFYCALCHCGFEEYAACEEPDCELETKEIAEARKRKWDQANR